MRESIGAGWIFSIVATFMVLFIAYLAISVNYAKAFKIKNHVVTMIENNEGYSTTLDSKINEYLRGEGYMSHGQVPCNAKYDDSGSSLDTWKIVACLGGTTTSLTATCGSGTSSSNNADCGIAIYEASKTYGGLNDIHNPTCPTPSDPCCGPRKYFRVISFFEVDLPVVRYVSTFKVRGETKSIYAYSGVSTCH